MTQNSSSREGWKLELERILPLYGHRNWIVIADSAYPAQASDGIETLASGAGQLEVLEAVLNALSASPHVKPVVHTDQELAFVEESDAPGINAYRRKLAELLKGRNFDVLPHEQIIAKLDKAGETFRVLIIKSDMTIPYTSVFLELDCAYWNADAEQRLRAALAGK
jgi:L-fucose mutarotase/ribose pyranase (RbsD/FucU family)